VLTNFGPAELGGEQAVRAVVSGFNAGVAAARASAGFHGSTPEEILYPARVSSASVIHGQIREVEPERVVNTVLGGSFMLPIVISIMILSSAQLAATSVASEKEQKTLEVLLTLPTRRENILAGKLAGVFVVALVGTVAALIGFSSYAGSITASLPTTSAAETGLAPEPLGYALLLATLLLAFVASLSMAVLVASYAKDIYGAQSLMTVVYIPVFLPSILLSFTPIEILPSSVQAGVLAIPFSYPSLAGKALYTHDYGLLYVGIAYQLVFTAVVLVLAARMFSTEKVLTARLSLGKRRKKGGAPEE
jgi:ABC-2 type transport system permease protein